MAAVGADGELEAGAMRVERIIDNISDVINEFVPESEAMESEEEEAESEEDEEEIRAEGDPGTSCTLVKRNKTG